MRRAAVVSLLWPQSFGVLTAFVRSNPGTVVFASPGGDEAGLARRIAEAGGELLPLRALLSADDLTAAAADAETVAARLEALLEGEAWSRYSSEHDWPGEDLGATVGECVRADLPEIAWVVAALDRIRDSCVLRLVVVNDDTTPTPRAAVLWARANGVPSLHLAHAMTLFELTVDARITADVVAVFGERALEGYLDRQAHLPDGRIRVTGKPAWDVYRELSHRRAAIRDELAARHDCPAAQPWIVFATTWTCTLTAAQTDHLFGDTLREFLQAIRALVDDGRQVVAIVKDRPPNRESGGDRLAQLVDELGLDPRRVRYVTDDVEEWVVAADVVVSVGSNVSVEALMVPTPAVDLVVDVNAAEYPLHDAGAGIAQAEAAELAAVVGRILDDDAYRKYLLDRMHAAAPRYNLGHDGTATARVVELMEELALPAPDAVAPGRRRRQADDGGELGDEVARLRADLAAREAQLSAMYASTSWPLSSPLRLVGRTVHRIVESGRSFARWQPIAVRLGWTKAGREAAWLGRRAAERRSAYRDAPEAGLLSVVTPVWNTPPRYLAELAASVLGQAGDPPIEWVVLDNGSTDRGTVAHLDEKIAPDPRVVFLRSPRNLGIVGGTRLCIERATGRYVLRVDHDDRLYPDCAATVAHWLRRSGYPAAMYSDEDKLEGGYAAAPFLKPDWDPVLFANQAFTAHLDIVERRAALETGAFADRIAEGSPDWDCAMRLHVAGRDPVHLPEVLYSWRMHAGSTAQNIGSKSYVDRSQRAVLRRYTGHLAHPERFDLELSPRFTGTPDWHLRRLPVEPRELTLVTIGEAARPPTGDDLGGYPVSARLTVARAAPPAALGDALPAMPEDSLVALRDARVGVAEPAWLWESLGLLERFADAAVVGGRLLDRRRRVAAAGQVLGFGDGCGCPDAGRRGADPGYAVWMFKQRSVSAVSMALCVVTAGFLRDLIAAVPAGATWSGLGAWAGAHALRVGARVVYSPFVEGHIGDGTLDPVADVEWRLFLGAYGDLLPDERWYPAGFGLTADTAYRPVEAGVRERQIRELTTGAGVDTGRRDSARRDERSA